MLTLVDIKARVTELLKGKFGYKVYGDQIKQGFKRPCFFVKLLPIGDAVTRNFSSNGVTVKITYFQQLVPEACSDDLENIKMFEQIKALFGMTMSVKDRRLHPENFAFDFVGQDSDVLLVSFDINYFDGIDRNEPEVPAADSIQIKL